MSAGTRFKEAVTQQRLQKELFELLIIPEDRNEILIDHKMKQLYQWSAVNLIDKMQEHKF